MGVTV